MSDETHEQFMARMRAMSSATHRGSTQRATLISACNPTAVANGIRNGSQQVRKADPKEAKARHLARLGYGYEDVAKLCKLPEAVARRIVFRKRSAWNVWVFGKREARS